VSGKERGISREENVAHKRREEWGRGEVNRKESKERQGVKRGEDGG
jgi:hypothetical protein